MTNAFQRKILHTEIPTESCRVVRDNRESCIEFLNSLVAPKRIARSEGKAVRVIDKRKLI